jgi:hypothetical protein
MASVGCTWTAVPRARSRQEYLDGLRRGHGKVRGAAGSFWKLTRDVFSIGGQMVRHNPWTLPIVPLGVFVPLILAGNYARELFFARWWMARYRQTRIARFTGRSVAGVAA